MKKINNWIIVTSLILFVFLGFYYYDEVTKNLDNGIHFEKVNDQWRVRSNTSQSQIQVGDIVKKIHWSDDSRMRRLDKYWILVNAEALEVDTASGHKTVQLEGKSNVLPFFTMSIVAFSIWIVTVIVSSKKQLSQQSSFFSRALLIISFFALSLVPSSQGNPIGRVVVTGFICLVPYYVFQFLNRLKISRANNKTYYMIKTCLMVWIGATLNLSILNNFYALPDRLVQYLTISIFYWAMLSLLSVLFDFYFRIRTEVESRVNFPLITFLSLLPLYWLYIVPRQHQVSYLVTVVFLLFPILTILHILIISGYVGIRYSMKKRYFLLFLSLIFSLISYALSHFIQLQHITFTILYSFSFFYSLFPIIMEMYQVITKEYTGNGIDLFLVTEKERERIAESIHDTVIQDVTFARRRIEELGDGNETVLTQLDDVIYSLRELCSEIYPLMLKEVGLSQTVHNLVADYEMKYPVEIIVDVDRSVIFSSDIENFILRSIKELFLNAVKHGRANKIELKIFKENQKNKIEVTDNGTYKKQNKDGSYHMGLDSIREKLGQCGGKLEMSVDNGTRVILEIPVGESK